MNLKKVILINAAAIILLVAVGLLTRIISVHNPFNKRPGQATKSYTGIDYPSNYYSIIIPDGFYDTRIVKAQAEIIMGDKKFLEVINNSIPPKTVFDNCGEGIHEFHIIFQVDENGKAINCNIRKLVINSERGFEIKNADYLIQGQTLIHNLNARYQPAVYGNNNVGSILIKKLTIYINKEGVSKTGWNYSRDLPGIQLPRYDYNLNKRIIHRSTNLQKFNPSPDKMPEYPGGYNALTRFIQNTIEYPEAAKSAGMEGRVVVEIFIDETGKVVYASTLKGVGGACEPEALRVIGMLKDFKPGMENGKPVKSRLIIPFGFSLSRVSAGRVSADKI